MAPADLHTVSRSMDEMVECLEEAITLIVDAPDTPAIQLGGPIHQGTPGHPRIDIRPEHLEALHTG